MNNLFPYHGSNEEQFASLNSYLKVAYLAISIASRPLHSSEIIRVADEFGLMPKHLSGLTPEKTLNARLAEHILNIKSSGLFYRTAPATYFLTHLNLSRHDEVKYELFDVNRRLRIIKSSKVLVAPKDKLEKLIYGKFVPYSTEQVEQIFNDVCFFTDREAAENDLSLKQFVTYTLVKNEDNYLVYRRGKYTNPSENLKDTLSIAFGGHVEDIDFTLFNDVESAFIENSSRELLEELSVHQQFPDLDKVSEKSSILGFINVDDNSDARQHIAVVVQVNFPSYVLPERGELGITELSFLNTSESCSQTTCKITLS